MKKQSFWNPYLGAVSLTFDDTPRLPSQLQYAVPAMEKRGLRGTFFTVPAGTRWKERLAPWVEVASRGHEIGNHTLSHFCSANFHFGAKKRGLEDTTLQEIESDILAAQERLAQVFPHQKDWTFCYPCWQAYVGRGEKRESYVPVVARHFLAARGWGEYGCGNNPDVVDVAYVWGLDTQGLSGFEMVGLVEVLATKGLWLVLVFHDVAAGRLAVSAYAFDILLDYLAAKRDTIWAAPFGDIARRIASGVPGCSVVNEPLALDLSNQP